MIDLNLILQRCRSGDELAWEEFVRHFQARVFGIAFHYVNNAEEARDLAQEIFIRIHENIAICTDSRIFVPWVVRISRNACIDHLRRKKARPPAHDIPAEEMNNLLSSEFTPEDQWMADSRKSILYQAVQTLGRLSREIIILKEIHGLSLEEISTLLSVPVGTVKSRSHRARLQLAEKLLETPS